MIQHYQRKSLLDINQSSNKSLSNNNKIDYNISLISASTKWSILRILCTTFFNYYAQMILFQVFNFKISKFYKFMSGKLKSDILY